LSVLSQQCLDRRIATVEELKNELDAWQQERNSRERQGRLAIYDRRCTSQT
ncbi:MAG: hypothetical protein F6K26_29920, partial [Moorea sp. SIO2I5]|nr:hypothetical protein [Moorena sp. SIO2I5]